uniref:Uncharacterized protein n=1 Tax=Laticauda laticaudata TaxID=8630 RepID=A0A8C5S945_LATLA
GHRFCCTPSAAIQRVTGVVHRTKLYSSCVWRSKMGSYSCQPCCSLPASLASSLACKLLLHTLRFAAFLPASLGSCLRQPCASCCQPSCHLGACPSQPWSCLVPALVPASLPASLLSAACKPWVLPACQPSCQPGFLQPPCKPATHNMRKHSKPQPSAAQPLKRDRATFRAPGHILCVVGQGSGSGNAHDEVAFQPLLAVTGVVYLGI